ncbi:hypothetical protein V6N13_079387 [Hibiscus sabdariffa]|uniref:Uncharacterized protein n=1 Tax=Hibiscus sabdariffa TaxID=183260 RepID=A0ABR2RRA7_9ROSI
MVSVSSDQPHQSMKICASIRDLPERFRVADATHVSSSSRKRVSAAVMRFSVTRTRIPLPLDQHHLFLRPLMYSKVALFA